ncbi:glycosyltransferase family 2 protein [Gallaecimonas pentaromativorans]|uniref:glycosyltransferase family 2 protein n=1 Tax=Gallaecimonas pentaromativorans TaxID=584787 RepID=UPI00067F017D|nr:glycosyltransferase family 2 protein [Gallaecimonas pentaromativorans]MED5526124.1 glycosyltransferase family 2 protein [Pseudomonadota bacterium]
MKLSAVIISKNVGKDLPNCLKSLDFVDEIVVLDSGSTDDTLAQAEAFGARIFQSDGWPGFGPQRQRAQQHAKGEWLFWIDADEVVTPELKAGILAAIEDSTPQLVYRANRLTDFFGRFIKTSGWYPDRIVRLHRNSEYRYDDALVHEKVDCKGAKVKDLPGHLLHYTTGDLTSYLQKSVRYANDWADNKARKGKKAGVSSAVLHSMSTFLRKFVFQRGFMDGKHGFLLAVFAAHYSFNKYAALWLKTRR